MEKPSFTLDRNAVRLKIGNKAYTMNDLSPYARIQVMSKIAQRLKLNRTDILILNMLIQLSGKYNFTNIGNTRLRELLHMSDERVSASIKRLIEHYGLIGIEIVLQRHKMRCLYLKADIVAGILEAMTPEKNESPCPQLRYRLRKDIKLLPITSDQEAKLLEAVTPSMSYEKYHTLRAFVTTRKKLGLRKKVEDVPHMPERVCDRPLPKPNLRKNKKAPKEPGPNDIVIAEGYDNVRYHPNPYLDFNNEPPELAAIPNRTKKANEELIYDDVLGLEDL